MDGFISVERFVSLTDPGKLLSLSFWRDEGTRRAELAETARIVQVARIMTVRAAAARTARSCRTRRGLCGLSAADRVGHAR